MVSFLLLIFAFLSFRSSALAIIPLNPNLIKNINLIVNTPTPTHILLPPIIVITATSTPVPPTSTPVPPTVTPIPPTVSTASTDTISPTNTPITSPATTSSVLATATPIPSKGGLSQSEKVLGGIAAVFGLIILSLLWPKVKSLISSKRT